MSAQGAGDRYDVRIGGDVSGQVAVGQNIHQAEVPEPQSARRRRPREEDSRSDRTGIFISYRRRDDPGFAGRLYDHLVAEFGHDNVFMDVSTIEPGADFAESISDSLSRCKVLIAVIGERWLGMIDENGIPRLHNPRDYVRVEIETALRRGIRVIPVLIDRAVVPTSDELPESMAQLARRHGITMSHANFASDVQRFIAAVNGAVESEQ
jgi:hypothetical protein